MKRAGRARYQFTVGALIVGLIMGIAAGGCGTDKGGAKDALRTSSTATSGSPAVGNKRPKKPSPPSNTVSDTNSLKLTERTSNNCKVLAPENWGIISDPDSTRADMLSRDGKTYAGWGIKEVDTSQALSARKLEAPMDDRQLYSKDPAVAVKAYADIVIHSGSFAVRDKSGFKYTNTTRMKVGEYTLRSIESKKFQGIILFHSEGLKDGTDDVTYVEPMHIAITTKELWRSAGPNVVKVAASIRCATKAQPNGKRVNLKLLKSDKTKDGGASQPGYNPQLGTEFVHSEDTGENYLVNPSVTWSKSGPEGAGYYVPRGVDDWVKLSPGVAGP